MIYQSPSLARLCTRYCIFDSSLFTIKTQIRVLFVAVYNIHFRKEDTASIRHFSDKWWPLQGSRVINDMLTVSLDMVKLYVFVINKPTEIIG